VWDEQSLEDVDSMLAFMLCGGFIVTMFMLLYALFDSQGATRLQYVPYVPQPRKLNAAALGTNA
jgi:hypothetical protein